MLSVTPVTDYMLNTPAAGTDPSTATPSGYTPAQIRAAYGLGNLTFGSVTADGTGQTIAIVDAYDDPNIASDLTVFDNTFGIAAPPSLKIVNQNGGSTLPGTDPNGVWEIETSLDVEWAHAIAPGANILLVEANDANDDNGVGAPSSNLFAAVDYARHQPGVSVISMSFGTQDSLINQTIDQTLSAQVLTTPAGHQGITFVAATGDHGFAIFPSVSPNVLAVGGTALDIDPTTGAVISEKAWGPPASSNGSGGGGISQEFPNRKVPDVSYNAAPETGFALYSTFGPDGTGWLEDGIGGTSAGSPQWAAMLAIANQGRALNGLGTLDGTTQTMPALYSAPASAFTDITQGSNNFQKAGPGYDLATGIGTPVADQLVPYLASYGTAASVSTGPVVSTGGTGSPVTSGNTGTATPTNPASPSLIFPVTAPASFSATTASTTQVKLFWSTSIYAIGYNVYEFVNGLPTIVANVQAGTTSITIGGLSPGTQYAFNLVAYNTISSAGTAWVGATTFPAQGAITPPQNFHSTQVLANQVTLNWTSATGESGYNLYQFVNGTAQLIGSYAPGVTSAIVRNLTAGTTYPFNLVAWNQSGQVAATPWIAVTTSTASPPPVPQNFNGFSQNSTSVSLTWLVSSGATGYQLYQFIGNQATLISSYTASTLGATIGGLSPGTTYAFNLLAFNSSGFAATAWIGVTTLSASSAMASAAPSNAIATSSVAQAAHAVTDSAFAQYATVDYFPGRRQ
ncbi:MAG TPA: fibronectin type III domain-containing protein [Pirellulales bacterium]|jgi:subtilase family serine protease